MNNTAEFGAKGVFFNAAPGGARARLYNMYVVNNTAIQAFGQYTPVNVSDVHNFYSAGNHWLKTGSSKPKAYQRNQLPSLGSLRAGN
jgi:hypothetical protein